MNVFSSIENLLYDVSRLSLSPVMLLIAAALAYALVMLGSFAVEAWQRRKGTHPRELFIHAQSQGSEVVVIESPGEADMRITIKNGQELTRYEPSGEMGEGQGARAGVTYRLDNGRMIYVPEE